MIICLLNKDGKTLFVIDNFMSLSSDNKILPIKMIGRVDLNSGLTASFITDTCCYSSSGIIGHHE